MTDRKANTKRGLFIPALLTLVLPSILASSLGSSAFAQIFTEPEKPKPSPSGRQPKRKPERAPTARPVQPPRNLQPVTRRIDDPAAFCSANGDADEPRASSAPPKWLVDGALAANGVADGSLGSVSWRCMDKKVFACFDGGASSHCQKPDPSTKPRKSFTDFCRSNPNSGIPVAVTGMTVALWECRNGRPIVARYDTNLLDRRGFYTSQWADVSNYAPRLAVGSVIGIYIGKWRINADGKGLLNVDYLVGLEITGGPIGSVAGKADYFIGGMRGTREFACTSNLILTSASANALVFEERIPNRTLYCPKERVITVSPQGSQLQFNWSKIGDRKLKVLMTGIGQK
jgi:hypothetical protein